MALFNLEALKAFWRQSSEFMVHRRGRLGLARRAAGALLEVGVRAAADLAGPAMPIERLAAAPPRSIFVLRNNDLGDVLVSTPLFEALRRRFPAARITAGVGAWAAPILRNNPNVDRVLTMNAPWFNKFIADRSLGAAIRYVMRSPEVRELERGRFDLGIDVLGSHFGAMLLLRAKVPCRLGVRGYAGGHTACSGALDYDDRIPVGRFVLGFAELLGLASLPPARPQLFLSEAERRDGEQRWRGGPARLRIVIGSGNGALTKYWPLERYKRAGELLGAERDVELAMVGGGGDRVAAQAIADACPGAMNLCRSLSLRQTFAMVASADAVLCNSSMLMHAAAAFGVPTVAVLGESYPSAREHARLWGYPSGCVVLGKEADRPMIAGADEAVRELLAIARRSRQGAGRTVMNSTAELSAMAS